MRLPNARGKLMEGVAPFRVLVIDDDPQITDTLVLILRSAGFQAIGVYSAGEARDDFADFRPNLVLADVVLPDGNGAELAMEFRQAHPDCRILLFSGQVSTDELSEIAPKCREFPLVSKPVEPRYLLI
jgi:DNA-binding response OmpR family regulator